MNTIKKDPPKVHLNLQDDELHIEGALTQQTVMTAWKSCQALLTSKIQTINFSQVTLCDSTSIVFLVALLREKKKAALQFKFIGLPKQMLDLAKVSGLEVLLG